MADEISARIDVAWQGSLVLGVLVNVAIQVITFRRLHTVVEQTNGMSHRLEQLAGLAGETRGRERAEQEREREREISR